jgi:hypothetical protein
MSNKITMQTSIGILASPAVPDAWKQDEKIKAVIEQHKANGWQLKKVCPMHLPGTTSTYYDATFIKLHI